jgi:hypothetical protein
VTFTWNRSCLACARPWIPFPALKKQRYITNTVASGEVSDGNVEYIVRNLGENSSFSSYQEKS